MNTITLDNGYVVAKATARATLLILHDMYRKYEWGDLRYYFALVNLLAHSKDGQSLSEATLKLVGLSFALDERKQIHNDIKNVIALSLRKEGDEIFLSLRYA